jgi:acetolactate synthase-1/2/3 large subunit
VAGDRDGVPLKVALAVAQFLASRGIEHVFAVSGGANLHMLDAIAQTDGIRYVCPQNEQAASFAADAYARVKGVGCAMATAGPGATNLITGIATSFYDSVPVLYLTGNQTRQRLGEGLGVRQYGFQATPITEMVRPVTKHAVTVMDPADTLYELGRALWIARDGRPGPVLVDLPDDIQRAEVAEFRQFVAPASVLPRPWVAEGAETAARLLREAQRPLFVFGWGLRLAGAVERAKAILDARNAPCVTTWGAQDAFADSPLWFGSFGTSGVRAANFAVQNADLLICVGTRLDTKATGMPASSFAPKARIVMVDIDPAELDKMAKIGRPVEPIEADCREFLDQFPDEQGDPSTWRLWRLRLENWRKRYDPLLPEYREQGGVNPYVFMETLGRHLREGDIVVTDTGCTLSWTMQGLKLSGQRLLHAFNQTPMGYGLPAAMGAAFASGGRVVLMTGDGGLGVNVGEFATIAKHGLPVKVILFDNEGHAMCRQTQRMWLGGNYAGTGSQDLASVDFSEFARSSGLLTYSPAYVSSAGVDDTFARFMRAAGPSLLHLPISPEHGVAPQVRYGKPIECAEPELPEAEMREAMAA